jgi:hypothetical protein
MPPGGQMLPLAQRFPLARTLSRISATRDPSVGSGESEAAALVPDVPNALAAHETCDPMHRLAAVRAVKNEPAKFSF